VAIIDESFWTLTNEERRQSLEGIDALMTQQSGVCIGVSTADCIPVLVYDHVQHVACAIHAGWRGTVLRIVMQAVKAMMSTYGSKPIDMTAQVGPGICLDSFEVGQEVYDAFLQAGFDMAILSRRQPSASGEEKWHIDLPLCNRQQLLSMGIPSHQITISSICTFKQYDTWFSARRLGIHSGRIFTGIMLHEKP
jgi:YfiH family protein